MGGHTRSIPIFSTRQLRIRVIVGIDGDDTEALTDAGISPPRPQIVEAVIDTGSTTTSVSPTVLGRLMAVRLRKTKTDTAAGTVEVGIFSVSIGVFADDAETVPVSLVLNLHVAELPADIPGTDVLIGMDVLEHCRLLVDGPAGTFTIEF